MHHARSWCHARLEGAKSRCRPSSAPQWPRASHLPRTLANYYALLEAKWSALASRFPCSDGPDLPFLPSFALPPNLPRLFDPGISEIMLIISYSTVLTHETVLASGPLRSCGEPEMAVAAYAFFHQPLSRDAMPGPPSSIPFSYFAINF